ncbi:MAG: diguanylate cyclase, partial [Cyanobacteria bacterium HKST-UBA06]|nr:diguanylate cyclase [Cyanobacteria bacterium HKST-UBA06]
MMPDPKDPHNPTPSTPSQGKSLVLITANPELAASVQAVIDVQLPDMDCRVVASSMAALDTLYRLPPALILVDAALPDVSGVQLSRIIKHDAVIRQIPLIMLVQTDTAAYVRLSEFSKVADAFMPTRELAESLADEVKRLISVFSGLSGDSYEELVLLGCDAVNVNATARLMQLLDEHMTQADVMKRFKKLITVIPNGTVLNHMTVSVLDAVLDYEALVLFYNDKARFARQFVVHARTPGLFSEADMAGLVQSVSAQFQAQSNEQYLFVEHQVIHIDDDYAYADTSQLDTLNQQAAYPFFSENTLLGGLVLINRQPVHYDQIFPFPLVSSELHQLMRLRRYYTEAQTLSISDPITGLYAYQHFCSLIDRELQVAKRTDQALTLICLSIANFSELEEKLTHHIGDSALKQLAAVTINQCRAVDVVGRGQGQKVLVAFPHTNAQQASIAVDRLQTAVDAAPITVNDQTVHIGLTVGMVEWNNEIGSVSEFI